MRTHKLFSLKKMREQRSRHQVLERMREAVQSLIRRSMQTSIWRALQTPTLPSPGSMPSPQQLPKKFMRYRKIFGDRDTALETQVGQGSWGGEHRILTTCLREGRAAASSWTKES
jgi:hypothetical protein